MPTTDAGIYYETTGTGYPLVMLHGVTLDGRMWEEQVRAFAPHYRCITVDRRAHGRSAGLVDGADAEVDLLGVLDAARVERCHLLGLSLGGMDAVGCAARYPERVASLVLSGAWLPLPEMAGWKPPARLAREEGVAKARKVWLQDPALEPARRNAAVAARVEAMVNGNDFSIWTTRVRPPEPAPAPAQAVAHTVHAPTLVMVGELEPAPFVAVARWLHKTVPGAAARPLTVVPDAGHLAPMENPTAFNRSVAAFWAEIGPAA